MLNYFASMIGMSLPSSLVFFPCAYVAMSVRARIKLGFWKTVWAFFFSLLCVAMAQGIARILFSGLLADLMAYLVFPPLVCAAVVQAVIKLNSETQTSSL
jgi:hypothetical protein